MHFGIKPAGAAVQTHGHDVKAEAFLSVCQQMMKKFPRAKKVITTLRGSISASHNTWAGVLYDGKKMYETRQYQITDIVDRVGGGDSFMGGLIYGLLKYPENDQNALAYLNKNVYLNKKLFSQLIINQNIKVLIVCQNLKLSKNLVHWTMLLNKLSTNYILMDSKNI